MKATATGVLALAGVAAGGYVAYRAIKASGGTAQGAGAAVGKAAVDAASGVVIGIGDAVGLPRTDADKCAAAIAAGDMWEASKVCPAADFLAAWWNKPAAEVPTEINHAAVDGATPAGPGTAITDGQVYPWGY